MWSCLFYRWKHRYLAVSISVLIGTSNLEVLGTQGMSMSLSNWGFINLPSVKDQTRPDLQSNPTNLSLNTTRGVKVKELFSNFFFRIFISFHWSLTRWMTKGYKDPTTLYVQNNSTYPCFSKWFFKELL